MCVYSLANDRVHPGGVALRNLEAGQSTGFDDEVIHAKFDILGFHFLHRGAEVVSETQEITVLEKKKNKKKTISCLSPCYTYIYKQ